MAPHSLHSAGDNSEPSASARRICRQLAVEVTETESGVHAQLVCKVKVPGLPLQSQVLTPERDLAGRPCGPHLCRPAGRARTPLAECSARPTHSQRSIRAAALRHFPGDRPRSGKEIGDPAHSDVRTRAGDDVRRTALSTTAGTEKKLGCFSQVGGRPRSAPN